MKIKLKKDLCVPRIPLHGEDALLLEKRTASAVSNATWAAHCIRDLLPELLRSDLDRALVRKVAEILIVVETANEASRWSFEFIRDEVAPHRKAIRDVLDAEATEASDAVAKPAKAKAGKRGSK